MSYELFWEGEPQLAASYRKADDIKRKRKNQELWLEGMYTREALASTVGNMFSKSAKHEYPAEPIPITLSEMEERRERMQKAKMEAIKAKFMARALNVNTKQARRDDI